MGNRTLIALGGLLAISVIVGTILYVQQAPRPSGDTPTKALSVEEFHNKIAGGCNRMNIASRQVINVDAPAKIGTKLKKFGKAVQGMLVQSRGLHVPAAVEKEFQHYLTLLDDVYRATGAALGKALPKKLDPLAEVIERVAKMKLRVHEASQSAGLPRTCHLGTETQAQFLLFFARANRICAEVSKDLDKELPKGIPTTPQELETTYSASAQHIRELSNRLPKAVPEGLSVPGLATFTQSLDRFAELFDDALAATQAFNVDALDAAIESMDKETKQARKAAKKAGLPACQSAF